MLKHVHSSTTSLFRCNKQPAKDTVSLNSSLSFSSGSANGAEPLSSSRSSSTCSLHDSLISSPQKKVMIKVYARVLCSEIEYKTLSIEPQSTSIEIIHMLLSKFKMRHRDPNLFYLTMEVWMRSTGIPIRTIMVLDDEARPAELQACQPKGESKFLLQMRRGGLLKVYDSCLMAGSLYKSLLVSEKTTAEQVVQLLLHCYNSAEHPSKFAIYQVSHNSNYERLLLPHESPLKVQQEWAGSSQKLAFHLRRHQQLPWAAFSPPSNPPLSVAPSAPPKPIYPQPPPYMHHHSSSSLLQRRNLMLNRMRQSKSSIELHRCSTASLATSTSSTSTGSASPPSVAYNTYENCFYI